MRPARPAAAAPHIPREHLDPEPPPLPAVPRPIRPTLRRLAALPALLAAVAAPALAQSAAAPASAAADRPAPHAAGTAPAWSYGIFVHHLGTAKRWAVGGQPLVEDDDLGRFIRAIGGDSTDLPHRHAPEESWNAAILGILGRQGWELVGCELFGDHGRESYRCYLKRPIDAAEGVGAGAG